MSGSDKKTVLITGASSGLGRAMAVKFSEEGFHVVGVSRKSPESAPGEWIKADITTAAGRDAIVAFMSEKHGGIDILINNAGVGGYATWEEMPEEELRAIFELNFFAPVLLAGALMPMLRRSAGTLINIASVAARMHVPCMGAYCAGKAALALYSDSLRAELLRQGVRVMTVLPGRIDTGFSSRAFGRRIPPDTPGGGDAVKFADKVFRAWRSGRRELVFPVWYRAVMLIPRILPRLYDRKNIQIWKL